MRELKLKYNKRFPFISNNMIFFIINHSVLTIKKKFFLCVGSESQEKNFKY